MSSLGDLESTPAVATVNSPSLWQVPKRGGLDVDCADPADMHPKVVEAANSPNFAEALKSLA